MAFDRKLRFATRPFKCYGGSQVTFTAEEFLTHEDADAVVLGEAEITLPELVRVVNSKGDISTIAGICYKDGKVPRFTEMRTSLNDLNILDIPTREILEFRSRVHGEKSARILSSRGCFYNCNFCTTPRNVKINPGKIYRERDPVKVVDEMEFLYRNFGVRIFYFNDDLYFNKAPHIRRRPKIIAEEILRRGLDIRYKVELRADSINPSEDEEFMKLLKASGLNRVFVGIESGSDDMLDFLNKKTTSVENQNFVLFMKSLGIGVNIGRILFGPYTEWTELDESIRGINALDSCINVLRRPNMKLMAFPGTEISAQLEQEGLLEKKRSYLNRDYTFRNPRLVV